MELIMGGWFADKFALLQVKGIGYIRDRKACVCDRSGDEDE